jgi:hypothetical protein
MLAAQVRRVVIAPAGHILDHGLCPYHNRFEHHARRRCE